MSKKMKDDIKKLQKQNKNIQEQVLKIEQEFTDTTGVLKVTDPKIKTVPEAIKACKIDLKVWEITKSRVVTSGKSSIYRKQDLEWNNGVMTGHAIRKPKFVNDTVYRIEIFLTKKSPSIIGIENILKNYKSPKFPNIKKKKLTKNILFEVSLFDHHFGKLAWKPESNSNYDLKIAKQSYVNGIDDLISSPRIDKNEICQILLPIGQDFFHVNDPTFQTPRGKNKLDTDGRLPKIFEVGLSAVIDGVYKCLDIAPVKIVYVPGNHDFETAFYLCQVIQHHFMSHKNVEVDVSPTSRKYVHHGINLIGYTHGCDEPIRNLPLIMADEQKKIWAITQFHIWHIGHVHKQKQMNYISTDTYGSVLTRVLPSLSGTDHWHYKKGYVGGNRAAEAHLWCRKNGPIGYLQSNLI